MDLKCIKDYYVGATLVFKKGEYYTSIDHKKGITCVEGEDSIPTCWNKEDYYVIEEYLVCHNWEEKYSREHLSTLGEGQDSISNRKAKHINFKYVELLKTILARGDNYLDPNRAKQGVHRLQIPHYTLEHDFKDGFPIVTAKKSFPNTAAKELHFFMKGEEDIREYWKAGFNIWNADWMRYEASLNDFNKYGDEKYTPRIDFFRLKNTYPSYLPHQMKDLIEVLETVPMATKKTVTMWDWKKNKNTTLSPCHMMFQVLVHPLEEEGKYGIRIKFHMGSSDVFLGLPTNIAYYSMLCVWLAKRVGMEPIGIIGDLSNVHLYNNSVESTKKLLEMEYSIDKIKCTYEGSLNNNYPDINGFKITNYSNKGLYMPVKMLTYDS